MNNEIKLDPKCLKDNKMQMAVTNNGELIPCCWCDSAHTRDNPTYKKLLAVSKIDDYEKIEDILETIEWKEFENNLRNNKGLPACERTCPVRKDKEDVVKKSFTIDLDSDKILKYTV